jgi:iron complex transport system ATP-binding protein
MKKKLLSLQKLSVGFTEKIILQDVNAELFEKTVVVLMGKNGIGKSCLLKSIAGLLPVKAGSIALGDKRLEHFSSLELAQNVAVVLTDKIHVDFLKVSELISLGRSPYLNNRGTMTAQDLAFVAEVVELMNLAHLQDLFFSDLSDGQKQKVMIARALAQNPKILILDEPTTHLDIPSRIELMKVLNKVSNEKNIGVLLSSHDAELSAEFADHIWYINHAGCLSQEVPSNAKTLFAKLGLGLSQ